MNKIFKSVYPTIRTYNTMSKKNKTKPSEDKQGILKQENTVISLDKSNNVIIQIHAKPGAKQNKITGITDQGVDVQINAPPSEGEANTELVKYVASVLGLRKSNVAFDKGFKSKSKTLKILDSSVTVEKVRQMFMKEMETN